MPGIPNTTCFGVASKGEIQWHAGQQAKWKMALGRLDGKEIEATVGPKRKKRSLNQNSYYWGVVVKMMAEAAGYENDEEMHDALRLEFLKIHTNDPLPSVKSTTSLSTVEFEDYMSKCRILGAKMYGLYIPDPGESGY